MVTKAALVLLLTLVTVGVAAQDASQPPRELPASAGTRLAASLQAAQRHMTHVWRDTPPINVDGTLNVYVEIARGDRRKWEFDMLANARAIDRMIPRHIGGYPVNYGFVPQTISYDGDPFDALVLGPPVPGGTVVRGAAVGVMFMDDETGLDSKVIVSRVDITGRPLHHLSASVQREIAAFFDRYKDHEPAKFSNVPGWGSAAEGLAFIRTTHAFFRECSRAADTSCIVQQ
jgi:inorganic pyrophosphatase